MKAQRQALYTHYNTSDGCLMVLHDGEAGTSVEHALGTLKLALLGQAAIANDDPGPSPPRFSPAPEIALYISFCAGVLQLYLHFGSILFRYTLRYRSTN